MGAFNYSAESLRWIIRHQIVSIGLDKPVTIKFIPFRLIPPPHQSELMREIEKERACNVVRKAINAYMYEE
jgi:hypothetical protein